jgi:hypothetical protein
MTVLPVGGGLSEKGAAKADTYATSRENRGLEI